MSYDVLRAIIIGARRILLEVFVLPVVVVVGGNVEAVLVLSSTGP